MEDFDNPEVGQLLTAEAPTAPKPEPFENSEVNALVDPEWQHRQLERKRQEYAGQDQSLHKRLVLSSVPFVSAIGQTLSNQHYGAAKEKFAQGSANELDIDIMAEWERRHQEEEGRSLGGKIGSALMGVPAIAGEAMATPFSLPVRGAGGFVLNKAVQAQLMPSMTLQHASQRAAEQGGSTFDPQNLAPAAAFSAVQNMVLGSLGHVASGVANPAARFLAKTAAGVGEMQGANVLAGAVDEILPEAYQTKTRYGALGSFLRGEAGEGFKQLAVDTVTMAAFTALHGNPARAKEMVASVKEVMDEAAKTGSSSEVARQQAQDELNAYFRVPDYKNPASSVDTAVRELVGRSFANKWFSKGKAQNEGYFTEGRVQFQLDPTKVASEEVQQPGVRDVVLGSQTSMAEHPALQAIRYKGAADSPDFQKLSRLMEDVNKLRAEKGLEPVQVESTSPAKNPAKVAGSEEPQAPTLKTGASEPRPEPVNASQPAPEAPGASNAKDSSEAVKARLVARFRRDGMTRIMAEKTASEVIARSGGTNAAPTTENVPPAPAMSADEARGWLAFNGLKAPESDAVAIAKASKLVAEAKAKGAVGVKRPTGEAPPEGPSLAEQVGAKSAEGKWTQQRLDAAVHFARAQGQATKGWSAKDIISFADAHGFAEFERGEKPAEQKRLDLEKQSPFPVHDKAPPYAAAEIEPLWKDAPVGDVPLDQLTALQPWVNPGHARALAGESQAEPVRLVKVGDRYYIDDGMHRAVAAKLRGDSTVRAKVVEPEPAPRDPLADAYFRKGITKRDQRLHQAAIAGEDSLRSAARKEGLSPEGVRKAIKRVDEKVGQEFSVEAMRAKEKSAREELHRGSVEAPSEESAAKPRKPTEEEKRSKKLDDLGDLIMRQAEQGKLSPEAMAKHKAEADRIAGVEALKEAKQAGIPAEHVEAMADDILAEHKESIRDWQSLYRDAYDALKEFGVTPQKLHGILTRAAKDPASIKGMDEVAQDLAEKYPSFFRLKTEHASDTLASILLKGKPQSMTVAEARETAADRIIKSREEDARRKAAESGETQPRIEEALRGGEAARHAELSAGQAEEGAGEGGDFAFGAEPDPARVAALMKQGFNRKAAEERAALEAAKQQHPQQAMGAAALGELTGQAEQRTNPRLTALAHAQGDIERENLDLGPAPARGGYSFERVNAAAEAAIRADPQLPGKILTELERKLRPLDAVETVVVEHEKVRLNNHLDRLNSILEMGDAIDQAEYRREQLETLNQIERLMDLTDRAGSEAGGAFVLRQQLMAEDYSAVGLTRRAAAAKGSPLTTEERAKFEKMAQEISRLQTKLAAFERPDAPNAADVRVELNRAKRTAKQTIGDLKLANLPIPQRVFRGGMEMLDASRALMTSMDFSAVLRQGGALAFGHPIVTAKALPEMFRATISEHQAALARDAIEQRPNSLLYKRAGLYLADPHAPLSAQEESFAGRWVKKIPGIAASERAYTTVLNRVRADVFDAMISSEAAKGQVSDKAAAALANFVNIASGRGNLGGLERAGTTLARIFFSPRFVASRFQLVAGSPLWGGTMSTRQAIIKEYARTAIGLGVFYGAAAMAAQAFGAKKDEFALSFDPRSADFGKIKMGNTRIDPLFGLAQTIVLEGRAATGQTKSTKTGEVTSLSNPKFGQSSFTDVLSRFIRSKLAPIPGALIDLREGKNVVGQPATLGSKAQELVTPIAVEDVVKAIKEQGVPTGLATGLAAIFGMGVQVYEKKQAAVPVGRR